MDTLLNYSPRQTTYPHLDREVEDAEALIDQTFNMIKENENLEKSKRYETNSKVYYEYELIKSYKERIIFLENQTKHLGSIISDLANSLHKTVSENREKTQENHEKNTRTLHPY